MLLISVLPPLTTGTPTILSSSQQQLSHLLHGDSNTTNTASSQEGVETHGAVRADDYPGDTLLTLKR